MRNVTATSGQTGEIGGNVMRALPKALTLLEEEGISLNMVSEYSQRDESLSKALAAAFRMMHNGRVDVVVPEQPKLLSIIAPPTNLGAIPGKKTAECFTIGWAFRDPDFDKYLAKDQPDADACVISVCAVGKDYWTFIEAVHALPGAPETSGVVGLGNWLIQKGHTLTLPQIEDLKERTERGEDTGLCTDGYGNLLFFVETGDSKNPVSVGYVGCDGRDWDAYVGRLGHGRRWDAGYRLILRNVDTSKL